MQHPAYPEAKRLESTPVPDTATNPNQKHDEKGGRRKDKGKCTDGRNSGRSSRILPIRST